MTLRRYGESAVLVEVEDPLAFAVSAGSVDGVYEVVPAARTVLVRAEPGALPAVIAALTALRVTRGAAATGTDVVLEVTYDGPDLADTAAELGLDTDALVRLHADTHYVVAFCGFVPGFAYLRGLDPSLHVSRLADPRSRVPAGAVGIAGEFTGVYPRSSPGGWRLLGRTDASLWDLDRDPPALLAPGTRVTFRAC